MRLLHKEVKELARLDGLMDPDWQTRFFGSIDRSVELFVSRMMHIGETQFPICVIFHGLHKLVGNAQGNVEVGDCHFAGFALDESFHVGMVDPQHAHIGSAARAALGNLAEGVVVDFQEPNRSGCLTGRGVDNGALRTQAGKVKAVAAAGLLDQGGIAKGAENAVLGTPHIIGNRQHKASRELPERCPCAGESRRIGEERLRDHHAVKIFGECLAILRPFRDVSNMPGDAPEHFVNTFDRLTVIPAPQVALDEHLA